MSEQLRKTRLSREPVMRRRWPHIVGVLSLCVVAITLLLPEIVLRTGLRTVVMQKLLAGRAGQIEIDSLSVGWRTPIAARGIRYRDTAMELNIESACSDRTLLDLVLHPRELGKLQLDSPRVLILQARQPPSMPARREAKPDVVPARPSGSGSARPALCPMVELSVCGGELSILGPDSRPIPIAQHIEFGLAAPRDGGTAKFNMVARTGHPATTAQVSATGSVDWPVRSLRTSLSDLELELVGVDAAVIGPLVAMVGLAASAEAAEERDAPMQIHGTVSGHATARRKDKGSIRIDAKVEIQNGALLIPTHDVSLSEPTAVAALVARAASGSVQIDTFQLVTEALTIDAWGTITDRSGEANLEMAGTTLCDWEKLGARLRPLIREDLSLSGRVRRPWRLSGPLRRSVDLAFNKRLQIDVATAFDALEFSDLHAGPLELAAHWCNGVATFDPVETDFQNGRVAFQPIIRFHSQTPVLCVTPGRVAENVTVDPKLCEWILRYVDPLSTVSGSLQGKVTLDLDELEIPLAPRGLERGVVQGRIILDDVEFSPNRSLEEILAVAGIQIPPDLRTSQSIAVRLENGRVYHEGLALPLKDVEVTLDGWVALDHSMEIRLSLPVTEEMLGRDKRLYRLLRSKRINVPITGTLEKPKVSEEVLSRNIQRLIQSTLRDNLLGEDALRSLLRRAIK